MKKRIILIIASLSVFTFSTSGFFADSLSANGKEAVEIMSLRSEFGKQFDNGDGTITSYVNSVPIHYLDDGEWKEIDNTLIPDENGYYTNKANSFNVSLPSKMLIDNCDDNLKNAIGINYNDYNINLVLNEQKTADKGYNNTEKKEEEINIELISDSKSNYSEIDAPQDMIKAFKHTDSSARYNSVLPNSSLTVDIESQGINVNLSFNCFDDIPSSISYYIDSNGLIIKQNENNGIILLNENDECIFEVPMIAINDSSSESNCYPIPFDIIEEENGYRLTLFTSLNSNELEELSYPISLNTRFLIQPIISTRYNSEASPNSVYYNQYLKIGGKSNNAYETYVAVNDSFNSYGVNATIVEAKYYMRVSNVDTAGQSVPLRVYSVQNQPLDISWNNVGGSVSNNTHIENFSVPSVLDHYWFNVDLKTLAQAWLNYANTSQWEIGIKNYGFKIITTDNSTVTTYSERASDYHPYFTFRYYTGSNYTLEFAPYKYNDYGTALTGKINNFQKRMNCYAYALQMYYRGSSPSSCYLLYPGEIGLGQQDPSYQYTDVTTFGALNQKYQSLSYYPLLVFTDEQIKKDAQAMGFNVTNLSYGSTACINDNASWLDYIQNDFNEINGRIILLVAGNHDVHFFLRNGDGTCNQPGHAADCSIWSHKPGQGQVYNGCCDETIYNGSRSYNNYQYSSGPWFYYIDKTTRVYNTWFYNGHYSSSTGTQFTCLD